MTQGQVSHPLALGCGLSPKKERKKGDNRVYGSFNFHVFKDVTVKWIAMDFAKILVFYVGQLQSCQWR